MTFLNVFFRFVALFLFLAVFGYFASRELILFYAGNQVVNDIKQLSRETNWKNLVDLCQSTIVTQAPFNGFQLRFTSGKSYNLEVSCVSALPALWKAKELPFGVVKTTGTPGFYFDYENKNLSGEITLELWGQKRIVYGDTSGAGQTWGKTELRGNVPASVCAAHGLLCCDAQQEIGEGDAQSEGVTDCSGQCYPSCVRRPVLLSFQSDPFADYQTREVPLRGSNLVIFSYVVDDRDAPLKNVTIDFGDGTSQELTTRTGQATKTYECATQPCRYTARIVAQDSRGVETAATRLSELTIIVGAPLPGGALGQ